MLQAGFITEESRRIALASDVTIAPEPERDPQFGFILDAATERANELMPELPDDLVIKLTIDSELQVQVAEALEARMTAEAEEANAGQTAAVLMTRDGHVLALFGGRDYTENQFNRATQAKRQPGSAFKTIVYLAALRSGWSPDDMIDDTPIEVDGWDTATAGGTRPAPAIDPNYPLPVEHDPYPPAPPVPKPPLIDPDEENDDMTSLLLWRDPRFEEMFLIGNGPAINVSPDVRDHYKNIGVPIMREEVHDGLARTCFIQAGLPIPDELLTPAERDA